MYVERFMNKTIVNLEALTVGVEGGTYRGDVDNVLKQQNLVSYVRTYPCTVVGGLVLPGAYGWLARN